LAWAKVHCAFPKFHYNDLLPTSWQPPRLYTGKVRNGFWALSRMSHCTGKATLKPITFSVHA